MLSVPLAVDLLLKKLAVVAASGSPPPVAISGSSIMYSYVWHAKPNAELQSMGFEETVKHPGLLILDLLLFPQSPLTAAAPSIWFVRP